MDGQTYRQTDQLIRGTCLAALLAALLVRDMTPANSSTAVLSRSKCLKHTAPSSCVQEENDKMMGGQQLLGRKGEMNIIIQYVVMYQQVY